MIRSHIGSTRDCGMVLKIERFSHLSNRSFGLGSPIGLGYLLGSKKYTGSIQEGTRWKQKTA